MTVIHEFCCLQACLFWLEMQALEKNADFTPETKLQDLDLGPSQSMPVKQPGSVESVEEEDMGFSLFQQAEKTIPKGWI